MGINLLSPALTQRIRITLLLLNYPLFMGYSCTVMKVLTYIGKISLLIWGISPVIFFILLFSIAGPHGRSTNSALAAVFILIALAPFLVFIFYIFHIRKNNYLTKETKYLWVAVLFFGNIIAFPFYWFLYVWKSSEDIRSRPKLKESNSI